jgi:hypothetical protein
MMAKRCQIHSKMLSPRSRHPVQHGITSVISTQPCDAAMQLQVAAHPSSSLFTKGLRCGGGTLPGAYSSAGISTLKLQLSNTH